MKGTHEKEKGQGAKAESLFNEQRIPQQFNGEK